MQDLVYCSAGFFLYEENEAKWYVLGMFRDFDVIMLPTVSSNKGRLDAYGSMVKLFQTFGFYRLNPFREVFQRRERLKEGEGEAHFFTYLVNDMGTSFSESLPKLPTIGGVEVIEDTGHGCFQICFREIREFEARLDKRDRESFRILVNFMKEDPKFLQDNSRLIIDVNNPRRIY